MVLVAKQKQANSNTAANSSINPLSRKGIHIRYLFVELICALFILLFIYTALSKLFDFEKFRLEIGKSPLLNVVALPVSLFIPLLEILLSVALFLRRTQLVALYCSFGLMILFTSYIVLILRFSDYIPCSCGGVLQNMTWSQHLIFNMAFIMIASIAVLFYPNRNKILPEKEREKVPAP